MTRHLLPVAVAALLAGVPAAGQKPPAETPANPENIAAALRLTLAAAAEYDIRVGADDKPLELLRDPVLKWSNPQAGEVHGNVFVWTRGGRPLVVGSLFKWFSPFTHMAHEFHSLAEEPLRANFHGDPVWKTGEAGLTFAAVPGAPAPAATAAARLVQLRKLAGEFAGSKRNPRAGTTADVRLIPQPVYKYAAAGQGPNTGGLFAFVEGTDPEIFLLLEVRGEGAAAKWQFAATRMVSGEEVHLRHKDRPIWSAEVIPWGEIFNRHERAYTTFRFNEIPAFLKDALDKPKPEEPR